ncbi:DUF1579 family protein [Rhodanobacter sp. MP1X3]|uniref:DUF1579 family protein n=1 Tax=Rhodanobacter sp. MP1X3 TaxID=2723086 RepID=UPI001620340B|nr:DUF1579 family protein [Rhodanobacter sp. MP1X3]MBB6242254.1 hypothetical protein [Rhodanobacter sp. MP1X3]
MVSEVLQALAGEWTGEEQIAQTRWGPGGVAASAVESRLVLGGNVLIQDYREEREGKPSLAAHAVFVAGQAHDQYSLYWFDSYGFVPTEPAPGQWDGHRLSFLRSSLRGQTRHIYALHEDGSYELTLESSFDGGVNWEPVLTGTYRRKS